MGRKTYTEPLGHESRRFILRSKNIITDRTSQIEHLDGENKNILQPKNGGREKNLKNSR
jgi:hypothetical protein